MDPDGQLSRRPLTLMSVEKRGWIDLAIPNFTSITIVSKSKDMGCDKLDKEWTTYPF